MRKLRHVSTLALCAVAFAACERTAPPAPIPPPTRGYVVISLDALRPDHLGIYGYERRTSPFLDSLAARAAVFERAVAQYPSTLASHVTMFTGLYPQEHGVFRPQRFLDPTITTLPEHLQASGFHTAGFTEGGFMSGGYGFSRGFDSFDDPRYRDDTDVERTFERGVRFLETVSEGERFFLFLHSYSIHDPYTPPERYRRMFWPGEPPPGAFPSDGPNLRAVNRGELAVTPEIIDYFVSQYDASIRYIDDVLADFWGRLEQLGLADETTLVLTSDHGEAFYEHGTLAHEQVYPEELMVPLIVAHPDLAAGVRVPGLVSLVDLAPTLYELAGVEPPEDISGRSLAPNLVAPELRLGDQAYGETLDRPNLKALLREQDGTIYQLILVEPESGPTGTWITRSVRFEPANADRLEFEAQSFHEPRTLRVLADGKELATLELSIGWQPVSVPLPPAPPGREVVLATDDCVSPLSLGVSDDARCLSFQIRGMPMWRTELYDLGADPEAQIDISRTDRDLRRLMVRKLLDYDFRARSEGHSRALPAVTEGTLRDLGYLN